MPNQRCLSVNHLVDKAESCLLTPVKKPIQRCNSQPVLNQDEKNSIVNGGMEVKKKAKSTKTKKKKKVLLFANVSLTKYNLGIKACVQSW